MRFFLLYRIIPKDSTAKKPQPKSTKNRSQKAAVLPCLDSENISCYTFPIKVFKEIIMENQQDRRIRELEEQIKSLQKENKELKDTVQWMHDLIWKMVKERESAKES